MIALVVTTESRIKKVEYDPPNYDVIKEAVGGWYELVHPRRLKCPYCMMVNEEGLLLGLPINSYGCYLYDTLSHGNYIVGDIVIVKDGYYNGEPDVVGMTEEEAQQVGDKIVEITAGSVCWSEE